MTQPTPLCPNRMQVHSIQRETADVWTLNLSCDVFYPYQAGQFALVSIRNSEETLRAYTLSSSPGQSRFQHQRALPAGRRRIALADARGQARQHAVAVRRAGRVQLRATPGRSLSDAGRRLRRDADRLDVPLADRQPSGLRYRRDL